MQFFFRGLLVAAITYFLKLGHNNHGLIYIVVTLGLLRAVETVGLLRAVETVGLLRAVETMGLLRAVETMGLLRVVETMGLLRAISSMGLIRPYDRLAKHGPKRPHSGRKRARVGIVRSWADRNGPSLIGRI